MVTPPALIPSLLDLNFLKQSRKESSNNFNGSRQLLMFLLLSFGHSRSEDPFFVKLPHKTLEWLLLDARMLFVSVEKEEAERSKRNDTLWYPGHPEPCCLEDVRKSAAGIYDT